MNRMDVISRNDANEKLGVFRVKKHGGTGFDRCDFCPNSPFDHLLVIHGRAGSTPIVLCPDCEVQYLSARLVRDYLEFRGLKDAGGKIIVFVPNGGKNPNGN